MRPPSKPGSKATRTLAISRRPRRAGICAAISPATCAHGRRRLARIRRVGISHAQRMDSDSPPARKTALRILINWGNHPALWQSDLAPLAQRGSSNSGTPVSSRYGLFFEPFLQLLCVTSACRCAKRPVRHRCATRGLHSRRSEQWNHAGRVERPGNNACQSAGPMAGLRARRQAACRLWPRRSRSFAVQSS